MAASNLNLGKASGGVLNVQPADGTTTTSLVLPAINGTVVAADSNGNVGIGIAPANGEKLQVKTGTNRNLGISDQTTITGAVTIEGIDDTRGSNIPLEIRGSTVSITRPTGTTAVFDLAGNVGIGVTPSAWNAYKGIQIGSYGDSILGFQAGGGEIDIIHNATTTDNGATWLRTTANACTRYKGDGLGVHTWQTAPSGTAGNAITWTNAMTLDSNGNLLLTSGTGGLGYGTGAGGTVTQLTSKSTAVTLNKPTGQITMNNAALAAGVTVAFILNNSLITSFADNITVTPFNSYAMTNYDVWSANNGVGMCYIFVKNISGGSLAEPLVINFAVIKGATE